MSWENALPIGLIPVMIGTAIQASRMRVVGRGKLLTQPLRHAMIKRGLAMLSKADYRGVKWLVFSEDVRGVQITGLFLIQIPIWVNDLTGNIPPNVDVLAFVSLYEIPYVAFYVDDILTGIDKDKWKKKARALKNKFAWKWTPAPVPVRIQP